LVSTVFGQAQQLSVPTSAGIALHDVTLCSGLRLSYAERGPRLGAAMLMLHGYSDSWFSFSRVLPLLPKELRVLALDQRGHGGSDRPASGYTIDHLASDVIQVMDALNIPAATIVGHSMGSFVARRVSERAPTRVARLILVGAAYSARTASVAAMVDTVSALSDPVDEEFVRAFQTSTICRPVPSGFLLRVIEDSRRMPALVWKAVLAGLIDYTPSTLPLRCSALVLGGDEDAVFSVAEQRELVRVLPNASFHIERGIGHSLHWEDPDRFVELMQ
jgi:pimeloyl-ACP methyl ester carboxylesterase